MKSTQYLQRLTWAARWQLPAAEADEVVSDYAELLEEDPRSYEEQRQSFGTPYQAVRLLADGWGYHRWLAVFGVLALCLLFPLLWMYGLSVRVQLSEGIYLFFLLLGGILSLIWFRRQGRKSAPLSRLLPLLLGLTALLGLLVCLMAWPVFQPRLLGSFLTVFAPLQLGTLYRLALETIALLAAAAGLLGLLLARLKDRRWIALYVLGLAVVLLAFLLYGLLTSMSLDTAADSWQIPYVVRMAQAGVLGLIGMGVALC